MSQIFEGFAFGLFRWEFTASELSASKIFSAPNSKPVGSISIKQNSSGTDFATGITEAKSDVGMHSAAAAFFLHCQANEIENAFILLTIDTGESWLCGIVGGRLWPSSDIIISDSDDLEYQVSLFMDSVSDETVDLFVSEAHHKFQVISDWALSDLTKPHTTTFADLIQLLTAANSGFITAVKKPFLSPKTALYGVVGLALMYGLSTTFSPAPVKENKAVVNWGKPKQSFRLVNQKKNVKESVSKAIKAEVRWLGARNYFSLQSANILKEVQSAFMVMPSHLAGWDAKTAVFETPPMVINNPEIALVVRITYQRSLGGNVDELLAVANSKALSIQVDPQGNVAVVTFDVSRISPTKGADPLTSFNANGDRFFENLSQLQSYCYAWAKNVNCNTSSPKIAKRVIPADFTQLPDRGRPSATDLLLSFREAEITLEGTTLFPLERLAFDVFSGPNSFFIKAVYFDFESHRWKLSLTLHTEVTHNFASQILENKNG